MDDGLTDRLLPALLGLLELLLHQGDLLSELVDISLLVQLLRANKVLICPDRQMHLILHLLQVVLQMLLIMLQGLPIVDLRVELTLHEV